MTQRLGIVNARIYSQGMHDEEYKDSPEDTNCSGRDFQIGYDMFYKNKKYMYPFRIKQDAEGAPDASTIVW
jgi:hypothetical protein